MSPEKRGVDNYLFGTVVDNSGHVVGAALVNPEIEITPEELLALDDTIAQELGLEGSTTPHLIQFTEEGIIVTTIS